MRTSVRTLRDRLLPAILTAAGVTAIGAGLLQYGVSAQPDARLSPSPTVGSAEDGSSFRLPSLPPLGSAGSSAGPSAASDRVATRIVIESLGIDLPVIAQPNSGYPPCNVAMYLVAPGLAQPGSGRTTYIYAHAQTGMFLPLLTAVQRSRTSLLDKTVVLYTSDDQEFFYSISRVIPKVPNADFLQGPLAATTDQLWLQTSTGPNSTYPKLQVVADPFLVAPADHQAANPTPHPVDCPH